MPTVSVLQDKNAKTHELNQGETLYDGLDRQGLQLPHGCLAGSCGSCKVEILEGLENLSNTGAVEKDTIKSIHEKYVTNPNLPIRLACRAKVLGNVKLQVFSGARK